MSNKVLGIDLGMKRIGLAEYLPDVDMILPIKKILANNLSSDDLNNLLYISEKYSKVVFGIPLDNNGNLHDRYEAIMNFIKKFQQFTDKEVVLVNEHKTTMNARSKLKFAGLKESKIKNIIDSNSAVEILERYVRK